MPISEQRHFYRLNTDYGGSDTKSLNQKIGPLKFPCLPVIHSQSFNFISEQILIYGNTAIGNYWNSTRLF